MQWCGDYSLLSVSNHPEQRIRPAEVTGFKTFSFFFSSRRRHTRCLSDWSSDVCSSDLPVTIQHGPVGEPDHAAIDLRRGEAVGALHPELVFRLERIEVAQRLGRVGRLRV